MTDVKGEANSLNNEYIDGSVTVKSNSQPPPTLVVFGALAAIAVLALAIIVLYTKSGRNTSKEHFTAFSEYLVFPLFWISYMRTAGRPVKLQGMTFTPSETLLHG